MPLHSERLSIGTFLCFTNERTCLHFLAKNLEKSIALPVLAFVGNIILAIAG